MIAIRLYTPFGGLLTTTLLAVDDSKTMRKVFEITFTGEDYRLLLCQNPDDALAKLGERPSVALVDAQLDGASGYDLCQRLKASQPGLSVMILSSKQQPYDRARGGQVGADDFIDKPFDTQQLLDKVSALAKKAAAAPGPVAAAPAPVPVQAPPLAAAQPQRAPTLAYGSAPQPAPAATPSIAQRPAAPAPFISRSPTMSGAAVPPEVHAQRPAAAPLPVPAPSAPAPAPAAVAAPVAHAMGSNGADFAQKLGGLGLSPEQVESVLSLSREVVERVVWEVVPTLAETLIREEIQRLTSE
jgi:CheY-like chemotaxis protein